MSQLGRPLCMFAMLLVVSLVTSGCWSWKHFGDIANPIHEDDAEAIRLSPETLMMLEMQMHCSLAWIAFLTILLLVFPLCEACR